MTSQIAQPWNVLFLCTGNSARSIMAEAMLNKLGGGRFRAWSAGSHPAGAVHPFAIEQIAAAGCPPAELRSKSWDEFAAPDAPQMDFIITVCDNAAGEVCPVWPGHPISAHWGFADPAAATGTDEERRAVFARIAKQIHARVSLLTQLPIATLEKAAIQREMDGIGALQLGGDHVRAM